MQWLKPNEAIYASAHMAVYLVCKPCPFTVIVDRIHRPSQPAVYSHLHVKVYLSESALLNAELRFLRIGLIDRTIYCHIMNLML